ncbi:toxin-antitoxin system YwqK family antitoxin [Winogradskyella rapida]|uniref:Toxin-antitoxin system YwqK family antitoxin n=1 Tax=Winogradskyella rapida TaxID=549701 RepID=A0ABW3KT07_9FLAO
MKTVLKSIFLLIISFSCFSQNSGKENLNLVFYDDCSNQIIKPEFEVLYMPHSTYDLITVFKEIEDWTLQFSTTLKTKNDTIRIPKILFAGGNELHSKRWTYLNCEKVCDGKETDFYANGNKRTQGTYENGKPIEIKEFRKNGTLRAQYFYKNLTLNYERVDYYDENENLEEYEIYKNKKRKTIIKTFDKNGKLTNRKTEKHYIERNK